MANRKCAYCGSPGNLSKEHIFPRCICERSGGALFSIARTKAGDKAVQSELTIGDVCTKCNNGPLSALDAYICGLHDKYFKTIVHPGDRVLFKYDFDLLLRWLLKIGYNVARARGWHVRADTDVPSYVLGSSSRPIGFRVFIQLIIPTPTSALTRKVQPDAVEIPPAPVRIDLLDLRQLVGFNMAFMVSLNSYFFHIFKESHGTPKYVRGRILKAVLRRTPGAYELTEKNRAVIYASSTDFMAFLSQNKPLSRHVEMMKELKEKLATKSQDI
jgi:hypothetical protein